MVRLRGLEPLTYGLEVRCSIQLSYRRRYPVMRCNWSGREDLNLRPPAPKAGALPGCATPRLGVHSLFAKINHPKVGSEYRFRSRRCQRFRQSDPIPPFPFPIRGSTLKTENQLPTEDSTQAPPASARQSPSVWRSPAPRPANPLRGGCSAVRARKIHPRRFLEPR